MPDEREDLGPMFGALARMGIGRNHTLTKDDVKRLGLPDSAIGREPTEVVPELVGKDLQALLDRIHQYGGASQDVEEEIDYPAEEASAKKEVVKDALVKLVDAAYTMSRKPGGWTQEIMRQCDVILGVCCPEASDREREKALVDIQTWIVEALENIRTQQTATPIGEAATLDTGSPLA